MFSLQARYTSRLALAKFLIKTMVYISEMSGGASLHILCDVNPSLTGICILSDGFLHITGMFLLQGLYIYIFF